MAKEFEKKYPFIKVEQALVHEGVVGRQQLHDGVVFADDGVTKTIGFVAMVLATANVVGGWFVTDRMLEMFKRR